MGEYKNVPQEINDVVSDNIKSLHSFFRLQLRTVSLILMLLKRNWAHLKRLARKSTSLLGPASKMQKRLHSRMFW